MYMLCVYIYKIYIVDICIYICKYIYVDICIYTCIPYRHISV